MAVITGEVKKPSVFIYAPSEQELEEKKATVVCNAYGFTPRTATIEWLVDGKPWTTGVSTSPISKQSDSLYMGSSLLTMSSSDYNAHDKYSCKVTHEGKEFVEILKRSECH